jgi:hypothetical protein
VIIEWPGTSTRVVVEAGIAARGVDQSDAGLSGGGQRRRPSAKSSSVEGKSPRRVDRVWSTHSLGEIHNRSSVISSLSHSKSMTRCHGDRPAQLSQAACASLGSSISFDGSPCFLRQLQNTGPLQTFHCQLTGLSYRPHVGYSLRKLQIASPATMGCLSCRSSSLHL